MMRSVGLKTILANFWNHRSGVCNVCGRRTIFACTDLETARGNMFCIFCRSSSRKRHVASHIVSDVIKDVKCIAQISDLKKDIAIYNLDAHDSFYKVLSHHSGFYCSIFDPDVELGHVISERIYCQNVEELTFDDEMFDIAISEDIFEHVRDFMKGFRSIYRVLKPGGYHIFTVPCNFDSSTVTRVDTSTDEDIHLMAPEYHDDGIRGKILAYRTFGNDIFKILRSIGFETTVHFSKYVDQRNGIFDSYVFVSKKLME
ncbi:MAG: class I SAM-dependent methyltransferase [bacterium]